MQRLREVFSNRILELAKLDPDIFVVCSDSRGSAMIQDFANELPEQFVEVGIAEQNCVTVAAGLASIGKKVFVIGPASFYSTRASEQIRVDVAYSNNNVKIIGISGGISYGALGATHHSVNDIALMRAFPNIDVIIPSDGHQMHTLVEALVKNEKPTYVRIGRGAVNDIYDDSEEFSIGDAKIVSSGEDVAIFACGQMVAIAVEVGKRLRLEGINASVVDLHTIKPLDVNTVLEVSSKAKHIFTIEEHSIFGGLGGLIAEVLGQNLPKPLKIFGLPDVDLPNGTDDEVFKFLSLDADGICSQIIEITGEQESDRKRTTE